ncbi:MAG: hypothetical protein ACI9UK_000393 [Candidatus Krumholzibacteriia bacterium]|jgi:hypothetical protein
MEASASVMAVLDTGGVLIVTNHTRRPTNPSTDERIRL